MDEEHSETLFTDLAEMNNQIAEEKRKDETPKSTAARKLLPGRIKDAEKKRARTITAVFTPILTVLLLVLLSLSGYILASQYDNDTPPSEFLLSVVIIQLIIFVFPCILYYYFKGRKLNTPFMVSPLLPGKYPICFSSLAVLVTGNILIKCFYCLASSPIPSGINYLTGDFANLSDAPVSLIIIAFAIVPAVCEEFFFRGIILAEYRAFGSFNAVIFSSICFAMIHFSIESFPLYLFSGIILGVTATLTRSVFSSMMIHAINNTLSLYLNDSFIKLTIEKSGAFFSTFVTAALFLLFLIWLISCAEKAMLDFSESKTVKELPPSSSEHFAKVFLSPGFFILVFVFLLLTLLG